MTSQPFNKGVAMNLIGKFCIVRTYSAGVHFGTLTEYNGKEVALSDAGRIWSWEGANTLHEIASGGVGSGSRVSVTVPYIVLTEAIEIIGASDVARVNLTAVGWRK